MKKKVVYLFSSVAFIAVIGLNFSISTKYERGISGSSLLSIVQEAQAV